MASADDGWRVTDGRLRLVLGITYRFDRYTARWVAVPKTEKPAPIVGRAAGACCRQRIQGVRVR